MTEQFADRYVVTGMTCEHCVRSVREEVSQIAGVRGVDVDLDTGAIVVHAERPVPADAVRAAVEEAGYALT